MIIISSSYPYSRDNNDTLIFASNSQYTPIKYTLSSSWIDSGDGFQSLFVDSVTGFYTRGYLSLDEEIVYYSSTSITGSYGRFCIENGGRGLFGTSQALHYSSSRCESRIISEYHQRHSDALIKIENTVGYFPNGYPTGGGSGISFQTNYLNSGSIHRIKSGTIEERLSFVEWAILELLVSGTIDNLADGSDGIKASRFLRSASWY